MKKKNKIIISCVIILILIFVSLFIFEPRTWGDKGDLSIEISLDKSEITINDTIKMKFSYHNNGNSKIRVLHPFGKHILLYDSNNSSVDYIGPIKDRKLYSDENLLVLNPHSTKSYIWHIDNKLWVLKQNETYRVVVQYKVDNQEDITLPFWKKEIWSNEEYFNVI